MSSRVRKNRDYQVCGRSFKPQYARVYYGRSYGKCLAGEGLTLTDWAHSRPTRLRPRPSYIYICSQFFLIVTELSEQGARASLSGWAQQKKKKKQNMMDDYRG